MKKLEDEYREILDRYFEHGEESGSPRGEAIEIMSDHSLTYLDLVEGRPTARRHPKKKTGKITWPKLSLTSTRSDQHFDHNYQRRKFYWRNLKDVWFNDTRIGRLQLHPHKQFEILETPTTGNKRLAYNILKKVLHEHYPDVKVRG